MSGVDFLADLPHGLRAALVDGLLDGDALESLLLQFGLALQLLGLDLLVGRFGSLCCVEPVLLETIGDGGVDG